MRTPETVASSIIGKLDEWGYVTPDIVKPMLVEAYKRGMVDGHLRSSQMFQARLEVAAS